jgi:hypothetical protein
VSFKSPILLVAFNRPKETALVVQRLREVCATKIYFAVDGPREGNSDDHFLVEETRQVLKEFDWDCEVKTLFQETNLGCGMGVSTAISWALSEEETIIVLEDDILGDISFFQFCEELLDKYKEDERVFAISGCNFVPERFLMRKDSYRFATGTHVWGWATWKRSWENYKLDIRGWKSEISFWELRRNLGGSWLAAMLWTKIFDLVAENKIDTWDYQLVLAGLKSNSLVATSNLNLTTNIGFGPKATHTQTVPPFILPTSAMNFPLRHPPMTIDRLANDWSQKQLHGATIFNALILVRTYFKRLLLKTK